jgi:hypothetical protein
VFSMTVVHDYAPEDVAPRSMRLRATRSAHKKNSTASLQQQCLQLNKLPDLAPRWWHTSVDSCWLRRLREVPSAPANEVEQAANVSHPPPSTLSTVVRRLAGTRFTAIARF